MARSSALSVLVAALLFGGAFFVGSTMFSGDDGAVGVASLSAQTTGGGSDCPGTSPCRSSFRGEYSRVGARLRLAREIIRNHGRDSLAFAPQGVPGDLTEDRAGVSLRFAGPLDEERRERLHERGVRLVREEGEPVRIGRIYLAEVPWSSIDDLADLRFLVRAESTWAPHVEPPLEVTSELVGASQLRRLPEQRRTGEGRVVGDLEGGGFDIYHPHLFRADGGFYRWIDADDDGSFDPGTDGVDLNRDGALGEDEILEVLDATVLKRRTGQRLNDDGELQPSKDWLFIDRDGDNIRDAGPAEGYSESDPAYGEPVFVVDDLDDDGALEPSERLVRLDSSKFKKIVREGTEYVRGQNLIEYGKPENGRDASHGTSVASTIVGGQPGFHDRTGLAPRADFVGYKLTAQRGRRRGQFGQTIRYLDDARQSGLDALVHEWTDFYATPQDGSTNLEKAMDTARSQGVVQVNPLGNLNVSQKHLEREVQPGDQPSLKVVVDDGFSRGGQTRPYRAMTGALYWRSDQTPTVSIRTPGGESVQLEGNGQRQTLAGQTVYSAEQVSPRGTHHLLFYVWVRQGSLDQGEWALDVENITEQDRLVGRVADAVSGWSVGIRWKNPTRDRGTMVFPSTADSAVGIAAFGARRARGGANLGELRAYSGWGPRVDGARGADLAAPADPLTAFGVTPRYVDRGIGRSWFYHFGGTSGAGPHAAAAVALLKEAHPSWGPDKLESELFAAADSMDLTPDAGATPNRAWGHGKVDVFEAATGRETAETGEPPAAALEVVHAYGGGVQLDASDSTDPDSSQLEYRFDFDYDGTWDRGWKSSPTAEKSVQFFDGVGEYTARVQVRDSLGYRSGAAAPFELDGLSKSDVGFDGGDTGDVAEPVPDAGADGGVPGSDAATSDDTESTGTTTDVSGSSDSGTSLASALDDGDASSGCGGCSTSRGPAGAGGLLAFLVFVAFRRRD